MNKTLKETPPRAGAITIRARLLTPEAFAQYGCVFAVPGHGRTVPVPVLDNHRGGARVMLGLNHLPPAPAV